MKFYHLIIGILKYVVSLFSCYLFDLPYRLSATSVLLRIYARGLLLQGILSPENQRKRKYKLTELDKFEYLFIAACFVLYSFL